MATILVIKEQLKRFYGKFDIYVIAVLKFFGALIALMLINTNIGYMEKLESPVVVAVASLLCSIIPIGGMALICGIFILAHFYAVSLELAGVALVLFLLMFLLYIRFDSSIGYILILLPLLLKNQVLLFLKILHIY